MLTIRDTQLQALAGVRRRELRRAQIAALCEQGFDAREDPGSGDLLIGDKAGGLARVAATPNGVAVLSAEGRTHRIEVDDRARVSRMVDPAGTEVVLTRDRQGRLSAVSRGTDRTHEFEFDSSGRVNLVRSPDGSETGYEFDAAGRVAAVRDANGNVAHYAYGASGRLATITDWRGNITAYGYAGDGVVPTATLLPNGNRREWRTGPLPGSRVLFVNGTSQTTIGPAASCQDAVEVSSADGAVARFVYADGRIVEAANDVCTVRFEYDAAGRIVKEESGRRTVKFLRNQVGSLIGLVTPEGAQLGFERDSEQRVVRIQDW